MGMVIWIWRTLVCQTGAGFINQYLKKAKLLESEDAAKHFDSFCEEYLRRDGIFVLQLMEVNVGGTVLTLVLKKLFIDFVRKQDFLGVEGGGGGSGSKSNTPGPWGDTDSGKARLDSFGVDSVFGGGGGGGGDEEKSDRPIAIPVGPTRKFMKKGGGGGGLARQGSHIAPWRSQSAHGPHGPGGGTRGRGPRRFLMVPPGGEGGGGGAGGSRPVTPTSPSAPDYYDPPPNNAVNIQGPYQPVVDALEKVSTDIP